MSHIGVVLHRGSVGRGDAEGCLVFNRALTLDQFEYINTHLLHQGGTMFYVYVEGGNAPKHAHGTKAQAEAEAQRLADVTGKPAHVLRAANAGETASLILFQYAGQVEAQAFVSLAAPIQPDPWFRYRRRYFVIADGDAVEPKSVAGFATAFHETYDIATRRANWTQKAQRIFYIGPDRNCRVVRADDRPGRPALVQPTLVQPALFGPPTVPFGPVPLSVVIDRVAGRNTSITDNYIGEDNRRLLRLARAAQAVTEVWKEKHINTYGLSEACVKLLHAVEGTPEA